jgi:adenosylmethionine-8-amino-7-oxononanoate aminotransferase
VAPDLIAVAKGLGAGYQPIGAVLVNGAIIERLRAGSGAFLHGHTYIGHPVAAAAALAVQQVIGRDDLLTQVRLRGAQLRAMLDEAFEDHPHVGDIRGRGLFLALELVRERADKSPFAPELKLHAAIKARAMENGLLVYPMGGTIDGRQGDHVLLAPPFVVTQGDLSEIVGRLKDAVQAALKTVGWAPRAHHAYVTSSNYDLG